MGEYEFYLNDTSLTDMRAGDCELTVRDGSSLFCNTNVSAWLKLGGIVAGVASKYCVAQLRSKLSIPPFLEKRLI